MPNGSARNHLAEQWNAWMYPGLVAAGTAVTLSVLPCVLCCACTFLTKSMWSQSCISARVEQARITPRLRVTKDVQTSHGFILTILLWLSAILSLSTMHDTPPEQA